MKCLLAITLTEIAVLLMTSLFATTVAVASHDEEAAPAVVKWEYRVQAVNYNASWPLVELNEAGAEGWELVEIVDGIGVFKRVKAEGGKEPRSRVQIELIENLDVIVLRGKKKVLRETIGLMRELERGCEVSDSVEDNSVQAKRDQPGREAHEDKKQDQISRGFAPRVVYLRHAQAAKVAKVLQDVYSDSQAEVFVGQMPRLNAVVVFTPYSLFWEIKDLVEALDRGAAEPNESTIMRLRVPERCTDEFEEGMKASEVEHQKRHLRGVERPTTPPPGEKRE